MSHKSILEVVIEKFEEHRNSPSSEKASRAILSALRERWAIVPRAATKVQLDAALDTDMEVLFPAINELKKFYEAMIHAAEHPYEFPGQTYGALGGLVGLVKSILNRKDIPPSLRKELEKSDRLKLAQKILESESDFLDEQDPFAPSYKDVGDVTVRNEDAD